LPARSSNAPEARARQKLDKGQYEEPDLQPADAGRYLEQLRASSATFEGESRTARLRPGRSSILREAASAGGDARFTVTRVEHEGLEAPLRCPSG